MLDVSVYSPSDAMHQFKYMQLGSGAMSLSEDYRDLTNVNDLDHGWVNGSQISKPSEDSVHRLFEDIEMLEDFWEKLPVVSAITELFPAPTDSPEVGTEGAREIDQNSSKAPRNLLRAMERMGQTISAVGGWK